MTPSRDSMPTIYLGKVRHGHPMFQIEHQSAEPGKTSLDNQDLEAIRTIFVPLSVKIYTTTIKWQIEMDKINSQQTYKQSKS